MGERGKFIVFEGCDGTGKSTMIARLVSDLSARGVRVTATREPGGTAIGEKVRSILLDRHNTGMTMRTEALLYAASRAQLVEEVVRPALEQGNVVICERYFYSSLVYQGGAGGLDQEAVRRVNRWATGDLLPDVVVLLDMDPRASLSRRQAGKDRIENRQMAYHHAVRRHYLDLAREEPSRFVVIDASMAPDDVYAKVADAVERILESRRLA